MAVLVTIVNSVQVDAGRLQAGDRIYLDEATAAALVASEDAEYYSAEEVVTLGVPATVAITNAAGAANVTEITFQVRDSAGSDLAIVSNFDIWLSDASTGAGVTATAASGTTVAKTACGEIADTQVTKKRFRVQTNASGLFTLQVTDTAKTLYYPCAEIPGVGRTVVGARLTTASYG